VTLIPNNPQQALLQAIYTALTANAELMAVIEGVYDHVPQAVDGADPVAFPYVHIGQMAIQESDDDTAVGFDAIFTLHVWSREQGREQTHFIQGLIYAILHRESIAMPGYLVDTVDQEFSDSMTDTDGETRHGVQNFRIIYGPTSEG
jgi:hypothetical protein